MKKNILQFTFLLIAHFLFAQKTISGSVFDENGVVSSASVTVENSNNSAIIAYSITDENGKYKISYNSEDDRVLIKVRAYNRKSEIREIENDSQRIDFKLLFQKTELKETDLPLSNNKSDGVKINEFDNKTVTLTVTGSGKTIEDAKINALRSAIEQAFGVFISSKTEILNDNLVRDEIISVTNGNIKSYEILCQDQLPDGRWGVTLKSAVSIDKLTSFVEAKGIAIEINGSLFAMNIKQQMLNEQAEINAIYEMVGLLHEPMQISFDYDIKSSDPKSVDTESKNWEIPLEVTATANKNMDFCANYFKKTIAALSLSPAEVETYKSLNKKIFPIKVTYKDQSVDYYLRKESSVIAIRSLLENWEFYIRLFKVQSGVDESYGNGEMVDYIYDEYIKEKSKTYRLYPPIKFPTSDQVVATFKWNEMRTLSQIEKMTGYVVSPRGIVSNFKNGGYVAYEKDGHGLVVSIFDVGELGWDSAKKTCKELVLGGYSDWRLPTKEELFIIRDKIFKIGMQKEIIGYYVHKALWFIDNDLKKCSVEVYPGTEDTEVYSNHCHSDSYSTEYINKFRAVRTF